MRQVDGSSVTDDNEILYPHTSFVFYIDTGLYCQYMSIFYYIITFGRQSRLLVYLYAYTVTERMSKVFAISGLFYYISCYGIDLRAFFACDDCSEGLCLSFKNYILDLLLPIRYIPHRNCSCHIRAIAV